MIGDMIIFTTTEIVVGECIRLQFSRELDTKTGFNELVIRSK